MGRSFWFECSRCDYRAKVSGGPDRGLDFHIQTVVCQDCRVLHDVVTRVRVPEESPLASWRLNAGQPFRRSPRSFDARKPPTLAAVLNRLPYRGVPRFRWLQYRLQCPVSALHRVRAWNDPDKCPRCGAVLERTALPYRLWE